MVTRTKKWVGAATAVGAAVLLALGGNAQAASATTFPPGAHFYTGTGQTWADMPADLSKVGTCQTLPQSARSYTNLTSVTASQDIEVYFRPNCQSGTPSEEGDLRFLTGTLNLGDFPYPAVSYRVHAIDK
ncbi:hypothetical protein ACFWMG_24200 [Streptomyces sp. NPDC127074]|uniref:hypothetical protein n=1 Tax=Streptomyces sp. NPDC127074 TaxID=3347130 RepID=UPI003668CE0C